MKRLIDVVFGYGRLAWFYLLILIGLNLSVPAQDPFLTWNAREATEIGRKMRSTGRVGGFFDFRVVHTDRSFNYKLRATWLTPEVIQATARLEQLQRRLTNDQARLLITEAESVGGTVFLVEIDPREGSGVIPTDWTAFLQPKTSGIVTVEAVEAKNMPRLRDVKGLAGVFERDYDFDVFWVVTPLVNQDGTPIIPDSVTEVELVVRIHNKEGRVKWLVPESIRDRIRKLTHSK